MCIRCHWRDICMILIFDGPSYIQPHLSLIHVRCMSLMGPHISNHICPSCKMLDTLGFQINQCRINEVF